MVFLRFVTFEKGYKEKIASSFFKICIILYLYLKKGISKKLSQFFLRFVSILF